MTHTEFTEERRNAGRCFSALKKVQAILVDSELLVFALFRDTKEINRYKVI